MNSFMEYFYNIHSDDIIYNDKYYTFMYEGYIYRLYIVDENINTNFLINLDKRLLGHTLINEIIVNRNNEIISNYNNKQYMLMKIYVNVDKKIMLEEISYFANSLTIKNLKINWGILWSRKIDYLEKLINENGKKYPIITDSFNYFVGMAENAISYYNNNVINDNYIYVISHKKIRFNDTIEAIYNPLNIIFDYRVRDIAEYIKNAFFTNNKNIFNEINAYIRNNFLSQMDVNLLVARLLYPSFYFELYEDILIDNHDEKIIIEIVDRLNDYEKYLSNVIKYFSKWYWVERINWLNNYK